MTRVRNIKAGKQSVIPQRLRTDVLAGAAPETLLKGDRKETENQAADRIEKKYLARAVTPLKAIRGKCVQCQGGKVKEIAKCQVTDCALHPFRMESNPFRKKSGS